jgi:hypothetical protein|tara:strand:- start:1882 stop:2265 length:384 start_codon:yes stop_codon:yes gene_type:complete
MNKSNHNRRRALESKLIKKSDTYPGYYKYMITIGEKDGTTHTRPCYGKDMQDALSRLINKERTVRVEKKVMNNPFLFFLGWLLMMGWPLMLGFETSATPWFIVYGFIGIIGLVMIGTWWNSYINRGE